MSITLIRSGLFIIACLSPLLTLTWLWQLKEWRIDRLKEHLRSQGYASQLVGKLRPALAVVILLALTQTHLPAYAKIDALTAAFALVSIIQMVSRRQRYPVWTMKAVLLTVGCVLMNALLITYLQNNNWLLGIAPMAQAITLLIVWLLFWPIDATMKHRVMQRAAALRSTYPNLTVVGITGSVGKTTTKELLAHILSAENVLYTPAYVNSEMGVSKWLLKELPKHSPDKTLIAIVEMGAYRMGEIERLCRITKPDLGIITYIGTQHLALFGSQQKLCQAKSELIASLPESGTALLNGDNELCANLRSRTWANVITVGTGGQADREAFDIEERGNGIAFTVDGHAISVPLHGTHNVTNVLLAIAAAEVLGVSTNDIQKALKSFAPPSKTFAVRNEHGVTVLDDTHNASPESFRAAIAWAAAQPMTEKILLTPGLIELGPQEKRIHSELGHQATGVFDRVIMTSISHKHMFEEGYGKTVEHIHKHMKPVTKGSLLVCIGKVSPAIIKKLLP